MSEKSNFILKIICFVILFALHSGMYAYAVNDSHKDKKELILTEQKKIVNKISYDDILQKAIDHSYDLKIADYNVLISKQGVRGARSEYFPKLFLGAGTEYTKNFRDALESTVMSIGDAFINPYTRYQSVMGINVAYNLFDFGVRGGNLKMAKEDVEIKELETKQTLQEMSLTLLDTYSQILIASDQIKINNEILNIAEKNLEMKKRLFDAKEISKTELNDAEIQVKAAKRKIAELTSIEQESLNWLSFYTGDEYDINKLSVAELKDSGADITKINDYTKSVVWKIHEKNIRKKELELGVVKRTNFPKLNLYGRYYMYGSDHNSYNESLSNIEPSNFSVGASLNMPLFDGLKNSSDIKKTKLELAQLTVERDKAVAQLMTKLANMRSNSIYLDEQIKENNEIIKELSDKEKSVHKLVSKRIVSPIEENDAKIELLNQKIELDKNSVTQTAIKKGIEILTEEI